MLNANYLLARLSEGRAGKYAPVAFDRRCMHEFVLSGAPAKQELGVKTLDIAKRLLDYSFHPPTVYFPLLVDEALMIEPTETETRETLDDFADALDAILAEAEEDPEIARNAPYVTPVRRLDEVGGQPQAGHPPAARLAAALARQSSARRVPAGCGESAAPAAALAADAPPSRERSPRRLGGAAGRPAADEQRDQPGGGVEGVGDRARRRRSRSRRASRPPDERDEQLAAGHRARSRWASAQSWRRARRARRGGS